MSPVSSLRRRIGSIVAALMFCGGLLISYRELHAFRLADLSVSMQLVSRQSIAIASLFAAASYIILSAADLLALRYVQGRLPLAKAAFASFVSNAINHTIGFGGLFGGSIRYRLYSAWGIDAPSVARVIAFASVTTWSGFFFATGVSLLSGASRVASTTTLTGVLLTLIPLLYLALSWRGTKLMIRGAVVEFPAPAIAFGQLALSVADWSLAGAVLYALLPHDVAFARFLTAFFVAQFAGVISGVPAGIGVFDSVVMVTLRSFWPAHTLLAALLLYRVIYYLAPLAIGCAMLIVYESSRRQLVLRRFASGAGETLGFLLPYGLAAATLSAGSCCSFPARRLPYAAGSACWNGP
jgi:phosphatidylglycerol lysyltransferase